MSDLRLNKPDLPLKTAIDGFLITKAADGYSECSININKWALARLVDYTGNMPVNEIDLSVLRGIMSFLRKENKPQRISGDQSPLAGSSLDSVWSSIRTFYRWAEVELGVIGLI